MCQDCEVPKQMDIIMLEMVQKRFTITMKSTGLDGLNNKDRLDILGLFPWNVAGRE